MYLLYVMYVRMYGGIFRKHVFGMSSTLYSGSAISILPFNPTDRNLNSRQGQSRKTPTAWGDGKDPVGGKQYSDLTESIGIPEIQKLMWAQAIDFSTLQL